MVCLDRDRAVIGQLSGQRLAGPPAAGQLGHVIYTSGSTGRPKGVMVERGALAAHTRAMIGVYRLGPQDRVLQFSQYSCGRVAGADPARAGRGQPAGHAGRRRSGRRGELLEELKKHQVTVHEPVAGVLAAGGAGMGRAAAGRAGRPAAAAGHPGRGTAVAPQAVRQWQELGLAAGTAAERLRADRGHDHRDPGRAGPGRRARSRSGGRCPGGACTSWTAGGGRYPRGSWASCTSAARCWPGAT